MAFFTEFTLFKGVLYCVCVIYVACTGIAVMSEPYMTLPCDYLPSPNANGDNNITFPNVFYSHDPCRTSARYLRLMGMTPRECTYGRHLVMAVILGSIIGYERRTADRPAGIRTMSVVSLSSALFTVNSTFVFMAGPMHWDPARVSAAIPSGVGFLGAGLIVKDIYKDDYGEDNFTVKGLLTAASVWLSAAVGIACGGGLYFVATFTAALMLLLLRFGPRSSSLGREGSVLATTVLPERHAPPEIPPEMFERVNHTVSTPKSGMSKRSSKKIPLTYD
mmetsp:Transcript_25671/g.61689  ORF Transcript_25671/g.61689 Transcript_25671/m.61689 type:complete len:277 (+) Transcript_25671:74-904(+)